MRMAKYKANLKTREESKQEHNLFVYCFKKRKRTNSTCSICKAKSHTLDWSEVTPNLIFVFPTHADVVHVS